MPDQDATLLLDRRAQVAGPGLHALLIGISAYVNLPSFDEPSGDPRYSMRGLASPALSAWQLARRLQELDPSEAQANPALRRLHRPLKTVRLLVSPTTKELGKARGLKSVAKRKPATRELIQHALHRWRDDAAQDREGMTLLYFGGHGLHQGTYDAIMLAADFCERYWTDFDRAMRFDSIRDGMAPSRLYPNIAKTQFYFLDCCRNQHPTMTELRQIEVRGVFQERLGRDDYRSLPTFFGTVDGGYAGGSAGKPSVLCRALLYGIEHGVDQYQPANGIQRGGYPVRFRTLKDACDTYCRREQLPLITESGPSGEDAILCWLDHPPEIDVAIELRPVGLGPLRTIKLVDEDSKKEFGTVVDASGLHRTKLPTGIYRATVTAKAPGVPPYERPMVINRAQDAPWPLEVPA